MSKMFLLAIRDHLQRALPSRCAQERERGLYSGLSAESREGPAVRPVVRGNLHQPQGWVLVFVAGLNEQDVLVSHSRPPATCSSLALRARARARTLLRPLRRVPRGTRRAARGTRQSSSTPRVGTCFCSRAQ